MSNSPIGRSPHPAVRVIAPGLIALALGWAAAPSAALAQAEEEAPAAAEPAPTAEPAPAPAPAPEPVAAEPAPVEEPPPAPEPEPAAEPEPDMAAAEEQERTADTPSDEEASKIDKFMQSVTIGAGLRTGLSLLMAGDQVGPAQLTLSDGLVDQVNIRPFMSAAFTEHVSAFIQFEIGTANGLGNFAVLDAIGQIKFLDELQLWVGQHIPANDRNNMNGPFFGNGWNFAITVPSYSFDAGARDRGLTFWGLVADGILKYHLSLVDLQPGNAVKNSRFAGRLTLNLLEPENYYYASGSYWGAQDTLAIGLVFQHQSGKDVVLSDGSDAGDFTALSADLFYEQTFGDLGTFTLELGYWWWDKVDNNYLPNQGTVDEGIGVVGGYGGALEGNAWLAMLSWLTPNEVGPGKIQANARMQYGAYSVVDAMTLDFGLAYVIDGFNHKYHVNYRFEDVDPAGSPSYAAHSIQAGMQYLFSK